MLVTGAGGFVGGHVARRLGAAGSRVRGLTRQPASVRAGDPPIEWLVGDIRDADVRRRALVGVRGVVHSAGWVSLGADPRGDGRSINVDATRDLLADARAAGVERFVYTSTLWAVAAGTRDRPADEGSPWNLDALDSPYCRTKREAERLVLGANAEGFSTAVICPGLVVGPRDTRPTSTRILLAMARTSLAALPGGGIPIVDAGVLAEAHLRVLSQGEGGERYVVAGPYLSYREMAGIVGSLSGRPRRILPIADRWQRPIRLAASIAESLGLGRSGDFSPASIAGGFLALHVSGAKADAAFGLRHPSAGESIAAALQDHRDSGRARWLPAIVESATL